MKVMFLISLIILSGFIFTGCGDSDTPSDPQPAPSEPIPRDPGAPDLPD